MPVRPVHCNVSYAVSFASKLVSLKQDVLQTPTHAQEMMCIGKRKQGLVVSKVLIRR